MAFALHPVKIFYMCEVNMTKRLINRFDRSGKVGYVLAWLLGVPLPLLLVIYLFFNGCG